MHLKIEELDNNKLIEYYQLYKDGLNQTKRFENQKSNNSDTKFLMHTMRLLSECEQLLQFGDMDLRRDNEYYKAIRRGEVKEKEIRELFSIKEKELEKLYNESNYHMDLTNRL